MEKYCKPVCEEALEYCDILILVDDGSTDNTKKILEEVTKKNKTRSHLIALTQNQGKGNALLEGLKYGLSQTKATVFVTIDGDGQHLPSEIPKIVASLSDTTSLSIGCRKFKEMPFRSSLGNRLISFFLRYIFLKAPTDTQSGFRAISRNFAELIVNKVNECRYDMEFKCLLLALDKKQNIATIPIETIYLDKNSSSHYRVLQDSFHIFKLVINYWRFKSI